MHKHLKTGAMAPAFTLPDQEGKDVTLSDFRGEWVVLYFYPKDGTSACTTEACEFTEGLAAFRRMGARVIGISPDSPDSLAWTPSRPSTRWTKRAGVRGYRLSTSSTSFPTFSESGLRPNR